MKGGIGSEPLNSELRLQHQGSIGRAQEMADSLFEHLKHGDEEHQRWLRGECLAWATKFIAEHSSAD